MTGLDALQSVQFVTKNGKRLAVLSANDWESLIEWLETVEDAQIAREAFAELKAAKGNRHRGGWLEWDAVKHDLRGEMTMAAMITVEEAQANLRDIIDR